VRKAKKNLAGTLAVKGRFGRFFHLFLHVAVLKTVPDIEGIPSETVSW
jgi:hypothetical protein